MKHYSVSGTPVSTKGEERAVKPARKFYDQYFARPGPESVRSMGMTEKRDRVATHGAVDERRCHVISLDCRLETKGGLRRWTRSHDAVLHQLMSQYHDLLVALRKITRAIDMHSKRLARETGLTAPQLLVLQCVGRDKRAKPSDIARQVHLSQATITSIVDRLVRAGLVVRERSEHDRRSLEVVLTEAGRKRLVGAPELLQEGFLSAFEHLADWEKSLLVSSMQKVAFMMDADNLDAAPILEVGDIDEAGT